MLTMDLRDSSREGKPLEQEIFRLQALPAAPGLFRWFLKSTLVVWHMDALADTAELVLSEIATNAVAAVTAVTAVTGRAAAPGQRVDPTITCVLRKISPEVLRIEVWDHCPLQPPPPPAGGLPGTGLPDLDGEHGRGLFLVEHLTRDWGIKHAARGGKCVWAVCEA